MLLLDVDGAAAVSAASVSGKEGSVYWTLEDGTLTFTTDISGAGVPTYLDHVGGPWCDYADDIKCLVIKEGIKSIGRAAFPNCDKLETIILPDGFTTIGMLAFEGCVSLETIYLPESFTTIDYAAFMYCPIFKNVYCTTCYRKMWDRISFNIYNGALQYATPIFLSHEYVGNVCQRCGITGGQCGDDVYWEFDNGTLSIYGTGDMWDYQERTAPWYAGQGRYITKLVVEEGVTSIGDYACYDCGNLKEVGLPNGLRSIGSKSFVYTGIETISFPNSVTEIKSYAFESVMSLTAVSLPGGLKVLGERAFVGCLNLVSINIPGSVEVIESGAFAVCYGLTTAIINEGTTTIGDSAFINCKTLPAVSIPSSVTTIENKAFSGCVELAAVNYAGCEGMWDKIEIGDENDPLTGAEKVFANHNFVNHVCTLCGDVDYPYGQCGDELYWKLIDGTLTIYGEGEMSASMTKWDNYKDEIETVIIEDGATSICDVAFVDCINLTSVTMADSVERIETAAFISASSLKSIKLSEGLKEIGDKAFCHCQSLISIAIPESVKTIGMGAFTNCESLVSIAIPEGVETIGEGTFINCEALKTITIPASVKTFGEAAFLNVEIATVYYGGCSAKMWNKITMSDHDRNISFANAKFIYSDHNFEDGVCTMCGISGGKCGDDLWWKLEDGTLTIYGTGDMYDFELDSSPWRSYVDDITSVVIEEGATSIGKEAFSGCTLVTSVTIPEGITRIGTFAFWECTSIESIVLPESVTSIGSGTFGRCSSLTSIIIPDSVTTIGNNSFIGCNNLKSVKLSNSITSIEPNTFSKCAALEFIEIPDGVTKIGDGSFVDCEALRSVTIPVSVKNIEDFAFYNCISLETINYGGCCEEVWNKIEIGGDNRALTTAEIVYSDHIFEDGKCIMCGLSGGKCGDELYWRLEDGTLTIYGTGDMYNYRFSVHAPWYNQREEIKNIDIKAGTTSIGDYAFYDCDQFTSIVIPDGVTVIGEDAFEWCSGLVEITLPESLIKIGEDAFIGCYNIDSVNYAGCSRSKWYAIDIQSGNTNLVREVVNYLYEHDFVDGVCTRCGDTEEPSGKCGDELYWKLIDGKLTIYGEGDMYDFTYMRLPWYDYASQITEVETPDGMTSIGNYAFYGCQFSSIRIPDGVTKIGNYAFAGTPITSIEIPDSVTSLGDYVFNYCSSLSYVKLSANLTKIPSDAFSSCSALKSISIPEGVTEIGIYAFAYCSSLASVEIPDSVTKIGTCAFMYCDALKEIKLPGNLKEIPSHVFTGSPLETVYIPVSVTSIASRAFYGCTKLTTINYGGCSEELWNKIKIGDTNDVLTADKIVYSKHKIEDGKCVMCGLTFEKCGDDLYWAFSGDTPTIYGEGDMWNFESGNAPWQDHMNDIKNVVIQDGATSIGNNAFYYCRNMASVSIPVSITSIGSSAFYGCNALETIHYESCSKNKWLEISIQNGNNVLKTDKLVFAYEHDFVDGFCTRCGDTDYPGGKCGDQLYWKILDNTLTIYGEGDMYDFKYGASPWYDHKNDITSIVIEEGATSIGSEAFDECANVTSVTIPDGITKIGNFAFCSCKSIESIVLPDGLTSIGYNAFELCTSLTSIDLPDSITFMSTCVFSNCISLTSIKIPAGIAEIKDFTFNNCKALTSIDIPASVTSICWQAFTDCTSLETVNYGGCEGLWDKIEIGSENEALTTAEIVYSDHIFEDGVCVMCGCKEVVGIVVSKMPEKTVYTYGEEFDPTGMEVSTETSAGLGTLIDESELTITVSEMVCPKATVTIEYGEYVVSFEIEIEPKSVTAPEIELEYYSADYTGEGLTPAVISVKDGDTVIPASEYTVSYENNINAGTAKAVITDAAGGNYTVSGEKTFEIVKIGSNIVTAPEANDLTYTGEAQELVTAGTAEGGTVVYSMGIATYSADGKVFSETIPTAIDAGEYEVWYKVEGDENHNDTEAVKLTVTIKKADPDTDVPKAVSTTYTSGMRLGDIPTGRANWVWDDPDILIDSDYAFGGSESFGAHYDLKDTDNYNEMSATVEVTFDPCLHEWHVKVNQVDPTCTEPGKTAIMECALCGHTSGGEDIPAKGHTEGTPVEENRVEATCTTDGSYDMVTYCTVCNEVLNTEGHTITAIGHAYGAPEWTWDTTGDEYTASVTFSCVNEGCDHVETPDVTVTSEVTKKENCVDDGERTYTATVTFLGEEYTDVCETKQPIPAWGHSYGESEWTWDTTGDEYTATVTFSCVNDGCTHVETPDVTVTSEVTKNENCTDDGERTYTATVTFLGEEYTDICETKQPIPAWGHSYGAPEWTWDTTGEEYTATVTFSCTNDGCDHTETPDVTVTSEVTKKENCVDDGEKTYTATVTFLNEEYSNVCETKQPIPAWGHSYGEPEWTWDTTGDEYTATVTFSCVNEGCTHTETPDVTVTSEVTKKENCVDDGERTYTATVTFLGEEYTDVCETKQPIPAWGHEYGAPGWVWNTTGEKYTATVTFSCVNNGCTHVETPDVIVTSEVTKKENCVDDGERTYTATVTFLGEEYTDICDTKQPIPAWGHKYGAPEWTWDTTGDEYTVTVTFSCVNEGCTHTETPDVTVTSEVTKKENCTDNGERTYTATVTFLNEEYTNVCETKQPIPAWGHKYGAPEWTWDITGEEYTATVTFSCVNDGCTHTETPTVEVTSEVTKKENCVDDGERTYTATVTFLGEEYTNICDTKQPIPAWGHKYGAPEWTWDTTGDEYTATVTFSCVNDGCTHTETPDVTVTSEVTKKENCVDDGEKTYTATVTFLGEEYTDVCGTKQPIPAWGHKYGAPEWTWDTIGDEYTATVTFSCVNDGCTHVETPDVTVTSEVTKKENCVDDGERTYTATVTFLDEEYTNICETKQVIPAWGHKYGAPEWTWDTTGDEYTATVTFSCVNDGCTHIETPTVEVTSEVTKKENCTDDGERTYTAAVTFLGEEYTDICDTKQAIPAWGHSYGEPEWTWDTTGDEYTATVTFSCVNDGCTHVETPTVEVTSEVTKKENCTDDGERTYTAAVTFLGEEYTDICDTKQAIPAWGHSYGEPEWTWDTTGEEYTATVTFSCVNDGCTHVETPTVEVTSEVTKKENCVDDGERTYTATVTFLGEEYTDVCETKQPIPAWGHSYGKPEWTWDTTGDEYTATVTFSCVNEGCTHTETPTVEVTSEVTKKENCTDDGERTYTAAVTFLGEEYTDVCETKQAIPAWGHTLKGEWSFDKAEHWHDCLVCGDRIDVGEHELSANRCMVCGTTLPTTHITMFFVPVNDYFHSAFVNGVWAYTEPHVPVTILPETDGEYTWHTCARCGIVYGREEIVEDGTDIIDIEEPVEAGVVETESSAGASASVLMALIAAAFVASKVVEIKIN